MNTAAKSEPLATSVEVTDDEIIAHLSDGRTISVPLAWSWRLSEATPDQAFADSPAALERLADEAIADDEAGKTEPLFPEAS